MKKINVTFMIVLLSASMANAVAVASKASEEKSPSPSSSPTASEVWLPTQPPRTTCIDTPGWIDSEGDGCDWYELADVPSCPTYGDLYEGSMGVANDNCCYWFGDTPSTSQCVGSTPGWKDMWGDGCSWYEANDQPGCPNYGYNWVGSMGMQKTTAAFVLTLL
jgi:hypothetical protein